MIATGSRQTGLHDRQDNAGLASMPLLKDWQDWWRTWGPSIAAAVGRCGWVLFLLDANEKVTEEQMVIGRMLRTGKWERVEDVTIGGKEWFQRNCPRTDDVPDWANFILTALYGQFCTLERLGREVSGAIESGVMPIVIERTDDGIRVEA